MGTNVFDVICEKDIEATAQEAATVFEYIREHVQGGKPSFVIGNKRYGANYVTEPLRPFLEQLPGVAVEAEYVSSYDYWVFGDNPPKLSDATHEFVRGGGNIFIVDGTHNNNRSVDAEGVVTDSKIFAQKFITRFPDAFRGYDIFFDYAHRSFGYPTYHRIFWAPEITDKVALGRFIYPKNPTVKDNNSLHFISSSKNAPFDDMEKNICSSQFSSASTLKSLEQVFIDAIQKKMTGELKLLLC